MQAVATAGTALQEQSTWADKLAMIQKIGSHPGMQLAGLPTVLQDLNRTATKISGWTGVPCFHTGYAWNSGDDDVAYWIPQGIAGSATATPDGTIGGRKVQLVSWYYAKDLDPASPIDKGARLAVVDVTDMAKVQYRLVLLAEPVMEGNQPTLKPIQLHVGGVAWYKDFIYVADTSGGLRVFDSKLWLKVATNGSKDELGWNGKLGNYQAFGYGWVLPQVARYNLCGSGCCARFSFVETDASTSPPSLVTGEYTTPALSGRLHRWPLDPATGKLMGAGGIIAPSEAWLPGVPKMQGAQAVDGWWILSTSLAKTSGSKSDGSLFIGPAGGTLSQRQWPKHPEDMHYAAASGNLWSLTEDKGGRRVFAVKLADLKSGCGK